MKSTKLFILLLFIATFATAQEKTSPKEDYKNRSAVSAAGDSFENSEMSISWTLGDTLFILNEDTLEEFPQEILELSRSVRAYPNPAREYLSISYDAVNREPLNVSVYDLNGKKLFQSKITQKTNEIPLKHLATALYEIKITTTKNQLVKSFKIIKH